MGISTHGGLRTVAALAVGTIASAALVGSAGAAPAPYEGDPDAPAVWVTPSGPTYAMQSDPASDPSKWPNDPWDRPPGNIALNPDNGQPMEIAWSDQPMANRAVDYAGNRLGAGVHSWNTSWEQSNKGVNMNGRKLPKNPAAPHAAGTGSPVNTVLQVNESNPSNPNKVTYLSYTNYGGINMNLAPWPAMQYPGYTSDPNNNKQNQHYACLDMLPLTPDQGAWDDNGDGNVDVHEFAREAIDWEVCVDRGSPPKVVEAFFNETVYDSLSSGNIARRNLVDGAAWVYYDPSVEFDPSNIATRHASFMAAYPWRFDQNKNEDPMMRDDNPSTPELERSRSNFWIQDMGPRGTVKPPHCCQYAPYYPAFGPTQGTNTNGGVAGAQIKRGWVLYWGNSATHVGSPRDPGYKGNENLWSTGTCNSNPDQVGVVSGVGALANVPPGPDDDAVNQSVTFAPSAPNNFRPPSPDRVWNEAFGPPVMANSNQVNWQSVEVVSVSEGSATSSGLNINYVPPEVNRGTYISGTGATGAPVLTSKAGWQGFTVDVTIRLHGKANWSARWLSGWDFSSSASFVHPTTRGTLYAEPWVGEVLPGQTDDWGADSRGLGYGFRHVPIFNSSFITDDVVYEYTGKVRVCPRAPALDDVVVPSNGETPVYVGVLGPSRSGDPVFNNGDLGQFHMKNNQMPRQGYYTRLNKCYSVGVRMNCDDWSRLTTNPVTGEPAYPVTRTNVFTQVGVAHYSDWAFYWMPQFDYYDDAVVPFMATNPNGKRDTAVAVINDPAMPNPQ